MRYSTESKSEVIELGPQPSNEGFFTQALAKSNAGTADVALILIGGSDHRSLAIRRAQSPLRFDRRASLWSHVAILYDFDRKQPGRSRGVEVTLDPLDAALQVPERNAVTAFALERYYDAKRYPNVGFVRVSFAAVEPPKGADLPVPALSPKALIMEKLSEPSSDSYRYPLWNSLGVWARYTYTPELMPNPLLDNVFMPSAALCEFGFEAIGVDLTPGAAANNSCPELIWSTVTHWQRSLESQVRLDVYVSKGDENATWPRERSLTLEL